MTALDPHWLTAVNTNPTSANKIHDDDVARTLGFVGGLVPGVDVCAYLMHHPAAEWGVDWLERGTIHTRLHSPVYDGDAVEVTADGDGASMEIAARRGDDLCATATTTLPDDSAPVPDLPRGRSVQQPPPASHDSLRPGLVLAPWLVGFHADRAGPYLRDVGEDLDVFVDEGHCHPGWILRTANFVLADTVRLGPWIHTESAVTMHGAVCDEAELETRSVVRDVFTRKGHEFVTTDVVVHAGDRPVLSVVHTAIWRPRQLA